MSTVTVNTARPYEVRIERGLLKRTGEQLSALTRSRAAALVADDTVDALYGGAVRSALADAGFQTETITFPHGEAAKTLATYGRILDFLAENRLTRADTVVALGGGVTGDLAGFAAATYLRGVNVLQIPTTLLAMVDSAVGGKTGVDLPAGKNLAGAFHQPLAVLCDPDTLDSLPQETFADGAAEAVKYGLLCDEPLFGTLETGAYRAQIEAVVERCVRIKAEICAADEREAGRRQLLNLGHTFGHAVELLSGYRVPHGHAVAIGMVCAARMAVSLGRCGADCLPRLTAALRKNDLPVETGYAPQALADAALVDKKRAGNTLTFVLPNAMGRCELYPVPVERLVEMARRALGEA